MNSTKTCIGLWFWLCATFTLNAQPTERVFEQAASGQRAVWRTRSGASELLVLPEGFVLSDGKNVLRFRWDRSMRLSSLTPEQPLPSNSYALSPNGQAARPLPHAQRVRAVSTDHRTSVLYYIGPRGLEFDVEVEPGRRPPDVRLESMDADFSLSASGRLAVAGNSFSLRPAAYSVDRAGGHHPVSAMYSL